MYMCYGVYRDIGIIIATMQPCLGLWLLVSQWLFGVGLASHSGVRLPSVSVAVPLACLRLCRPPPSFSHCLPSYLSPDCSPVGLSGSSLPHTKNQLKIIFKCYFLLFHYSISGTKSQANPCDTRGWNFFKKILKKVLTNT